MCAKRKFALFTCKASHFSFVEVQKMPEESSHFSLARDHTFHFTGVSKKCQNKVRTFHLQGSHFSFAGCPKKWQKELHTFHMQGIRKNASIFWPSCKWKVWPHASEKFSVDTDDKQGDLGAAHQKLKSSVHTEHKWAVAWWKFTLMDQQPIGSSGEPSLFSSAWNVIHIRAPNRLGALRLGLAL